MIEEGERPCPTTRRDGNGNSAEGERETKYEQSSEEALAALIAAVGDGQRTLAAKLVDLVRDVYPSRRRDPA